MLFSIKLSTALLTLVLATPLRAQALNDWSVPCTQGVCFWDLPAESGAEGWIKIVSVLYLYQARRGPVPFADIIYLRMHSGALLV